MIFRIIFTLKNRERLCVICSSLSPLSKLATRLQTLVHKFKLQGRGSCLLGRGASSLPVVLPFIFEHDRKLVY